MKGWQKKVALEDLGNYVWSLESTWTFRTRGVLDLEIHRDPS